VRTNSEASAFELEMAADYGSDILTEEEKKELILYIAEKIGLEVKGDLTVNRKDNDSEIFIQKDNKNADTTIKLVSLEQKNSTGNAKIKNYLLVRLKIYKNAESILYYRKLLESVFNGLNTSNIQTTMKLTNNYKGRLTLDEMNQIADGMIKGLQGNVAYANRQKDLFTVYAYSGLLKEYITSADTKINIQVAIDYDETSDCTNVYLGTPVISGEY
jgi:hypothetical protein